MFLKTEQFEYNGVSVTLSELSALQRIEHLALLKRRAEQAESSGKPKTPRTQTTDNGKQNTYFSSLDNMVAQGNVLPVLYGEMRVGSRVASQEISTADEGDGGQVVVIGR